MGASPSAPARLCPACPECPKCSCQSAECFDMPGEMCDTVKDFADCPRSPFDVQTCKNTSGYITTKRTFDNDQSAIFATVENGGDITVDGKVYNTKGTLWMEQRIEALEESNQELLNTKNENDSAINSLKIDLQQLGQSVGSDMSAGLNSCMAETPAHQEAAEGCYTVEQSAQNKRNESCALLKKSKDKSDNINGLGWSQCACPEGTLKNDHGVCPDGETSCASCSSEFWKDGTGCKRLTTCALGESYETRTPTATRDRQCTQVRSCPNGQTENTAPTLTSDRVCRDKQCTCAHGTAATGTSCPTDGSVMCASCSNGYVLKGVNKAGTSTTNTTCESCPDNHYESGGSCHKKRSCSYTKSDGSATTNRTCHAPVDCKMGGWGSYTSCQSGRYSASAYYCYKGYKYRYRSETTKAKYGGKACTGNTSDYASCNLSTSQRQSYCSDRWSSCYAGSNRDSKIRTWCSYYGRTYKSNGGKWKSCGSGKFKGYCTVSGK